jgi:hypothetical protein
MAPAVGYTKAAPSEPPKIRRCASSDLHPRTFYLQPGSRLSASVSLGPSQVDDRLFYAECRPPSLGVHDGLADVEIDNLKTLATWRRLESKPLFGAEGTNGNDLIPHCGSAQSSASFTAEKRPPCSAIGLLVSETLGLSDRGSREMRRT